MKAELTCFVITSSEGRGVAKGWNWKPGEVGKRVESGESDECATWIILWGDEPCEVVEEQRER